MKKQVKETTDPNRPKLQIKLITRRLQQVQGGASVVGWGVATERADSGQK